MNFNSPLFFIFVTVVITVNYFLSPRYRSSFLVFSSLVFIAYHSVDSLLAVLALTIFNFYIGSKVKDNRKLFYAGIAVNAIAIVLANYLSSSDKGVHFYFSGITFDIRSVIIAVGISFYSLQNIAYLIEIYFKRTLPEPSFSRYLLSTSFFPKIVSGPVTLPNEFLPQIEINTVSQEKLISGFNRFLLGLFKKMVIADRLSPTVHSIFDYSTDYHGLTTLVGVYVFTIQLYFDFSGYTDMALGIAKMLGYDLKENFNAPFRSRSVSEFWRRWHISLISWFTTYIYYPVVYQLRRYKKGSVLIGIVLIFFISSVWHGISFTFFAWAACHAIYVSFEYVTKQFRLNFAKRFNQKIVGVLSVFFVLNAVCFSNIFFRSSSIESAFRLIKNTFSNFIPTDWLSEFVSPLAVGGHQIEQFNFLISLLIPLLVLLFERTINRFAIREKFSISYVVTAVLLIMVFGIFSNGSRFIYMQF